MYQVAIIFGFALSGLTLILFPEQITAALAWRLPDAMLPRSAGTYFPGFTDENGFGHQLLRLGWILLLSSLAAITLVAERFRSVIAQLQEHGISEPHYRIILILLAIAAAGTYLHFGWWPDAYPSNARIHWVDGFYNRAERHTYALTKFVYQFFYDSPRLLVGLLGTLHVLLFAGIIRRLTTNTLLGAGAGVSWLISSNVLLFANMAEDVNLSFVVLLATVYACVRRWSIAFGILAFLASSTRPTHGLLFAGLWGAEFLAACSSSGLRSALRAVFSGHFLGKSLLALLAPLLAWHGWMVLAGQHFLVLTENSAVDILSGQESLAIDGYAISQFSGTALLHMLWVFPLPALALWFAGLLFVARYELANHRTFILGSFVFIAVNILIVEYLKMFYFNVRYITYYLPFILATAWIVLARLPVATTPLKFTLILILTVSTFAPYNFAPARLEKVRTTPLSALYAHRMEMREFLEGCDKVFTDQTARSQRNYLAYLLKRESIAIAALKTQQVSDSKCVVIRSSRVQIPGEWIKMELGTKFRIAKQRN